MKECPEHTGTDKEETNVGPKSESQKHSSSLFLVFYLSVPIMGSRWPSPRRFRGFRARWTLTRNSIQG